MPDGRVVFIEGEKDEHDKGLEYMTGILYLIGFLIAWPLFTGMLFAYFQDPYFGKEFNKREARNDLGTAAFISLVAALLWPIGWLPIVCGTGFCEHGIRFK